MKTDGGHLEIDMCSWVDFYAKDIVPLLILLKYFFGSQQSQLLRLNPPDERYYLKAESGFLSTSYMYLKRKSANTV